MEIFLFTFGRTCAPLNLEGIVSPSRTCRRAPSSPAANSKVYTEYIHSKDRGRISLHSVVYTVSYEKREIRFSGIRKSPNVRSRNVDDIKTYTNSFDE